MNLLRNFLLLLLLLPCAPLAAQNIFELNQKLGKGINLGNMFEAPSETEWGNPYDERFPALIAAQGFNHVRVPIRWDVPARAMQNAPYTINADFLNRVKTVVDQCRSAGLMVIINMHHHEALFESPAQHKERFLSQWQQIAEYFKDDDENLIFEVLNEPHGGLTPELWNQYFYEAYSKIRLSNPTRAILLGVAEYGGLAAISKIQLPPVTNVILTIHYYDPFNFTHQGADWVGDQSQAWLGTKWNNTDLERKTIENQFAFAKSFAQKQQFPVHIGEFGAFEKADLESRIKWTNFLARWFESQGFSWAYWEWSAGFGVYDRNASKMKKELADALTKDPLSEPVITQTAPIYSSDFSTGNNAWSLGVNGTAVANLKNENAALSVDISTKSDQGWHIQLQRGSIPLKKGKTYLASFTAQADREMSLTSYVGRASAPFDSYSGYTSYTINEAEQSFFYTFQMAANDDPQARMAFDFGTTLGKVSFKNMSVAEVISTDQEETVLSIPSSAFSIYPNPTQQYLYFSQMKPDQKIEIFNASGEMVKSLVASEPTFQIAISGMNPGVYMVKVSDHQGFVSKKIVVH